MKHWQAYAFWILLIFTIPASCTYVWHKEKEQEDLVAKHQDQMAEVLRIQEDLLAMVKRDDRLLRLLLGNWDRQKPVYRRHSGDNAHGPVYHFSQDMEWIERNKGEEYAEWLAEKKKREVPNDIYEGAPPERSDDLHERAAR